MDVGFILLIEICINFCQGEMMSTRSVYITSFMIVAICCSSWIQTADCQTDSSKIERYEKYVEAIFKRYDKDMNGRLEKDETKLMRSSRLPSTGTKGYLTKNEMVQFYLDGINRNKKISQKSGNPISGLLGGGGGAIANISGNGDMLSSMLAGGMNKSASTVFRLKANVVVCADLEKEELAKLKAKFEKLKFKELGSKMDLDKKFIQDSLSVSIAKDSETTFGISDYPGVSQAEMLRGRNNSRNDTTFRTTATFSLDAKGDNIYVTMNFSKNYPQKTKPNEGSVMVSDATHRLELTSVLVCKNGKNSVSLISSNGKSVFVLVGAESVD